MLLISLSIALSIGEINWLQVVISEGAEKVMNDHIYKQLQNLVILNSQAISLEFSGYLSLTTYLASLSTSICESTYILQTGTPTFDVTKASSQQTGVFFSKDELSEKGKELTIQESSLDYIFPFLFNKDKLLQMYIGYELDHLFHIYPSTQMPYKYNPSVREWYYTAKLSQLSAVFTEPYIDASKRVWIISSSKSIYCYEDFIGVAAVDITLAALTERIFKTKVPLEGFMMLISSSGMIITMPESWEGETARLNDTEITGFSSEMWKDVMNTKIEVTHRFTFTDKNATEYDCFRDFLRPAGDDTVTHYLFACSPSEPTKSQISDAKVLYNQLSMRLFWIIFSVSFTVLIVIMTIIFCLSKEINEEIGFIKNSSFKVCEKALFPDALGNMAIVPKNFDNNMFGLINLGLGKMREMRYKINQMAEYAWGSTRPKDIYLFEEWRMKLYPRGNTSCGQMKWNSVFISMVKKFVK
ncbi:hypothetical protein SteCoe_15485 [Stentor coeruleus]|uniref:Cache domain-containing protein n=1 Tax=Stentor coeruleus TaxID=5963 RepID=A0A1R2C3R4_9CILI|nr:hypothetical protein SteCoe_15485 [Stentor coeruleus]